MNFDQLEARYRELVAQRQAGVLDPQQFQELAATLRTQDTGQRWWQLDPVSGDWLVWDGRQWQRNEPPRGQSPGIQAPPPPAVSPAGPSAAPGAASSAAMQTATGVAKNLWQRFLDRMISPSEFLRQGKLPLAQRSQGWWDVLGIAGGALSGYIWFVYASIRGMPHFKLIGMNGGREAWYDFLPAILLAALPFLLFAYRRGILEKLDPIWSKARMSPSYGLTLVGGIVGGALALNYLGPVLFSWAFAFREGLDFTTPLLMVAIPLGLALFRPETDRLLTPLQPARQGIPKFLLVGIALATPYALAFVLYRLMNQYELLHWNVALGILISYALLRNPQPGHTSSGGGGVGALSLFFWLLPMLLLLSGTFIPEAFADDCMRDLFNLRDCLRTGGYAEIMSGTAASIVSVLVNGSEIVRIFLPPPSGQQTQAPLETQDLQPEPPTAAARDVEWTSSDGRKNELVWNAEKNGYINILTGGFVPANGVEEWKQNVEDNIQRTNEWRDHNKQLTDHGLDEQSQKLAAIQAEMDARAAVAASQAADDASRQVTPAQSKAISDEMDRLIKEKTTEGYYVGNANLISKIWNNPITKPIVDHFTGNTRGQCGEFGEWGQQWIAPAIKQQFGDKAIVTDIVQHRTGITNPIDGSYIITHRATRVIQPDGSRIVVDFWEGMQNGKASIYTEKAWVDKWKTSFNSGQPQNTNRSGEEQALKTMTSNYGETKGKEVFEKTFKKNKDQAKTLIKSWEKEPW